MKSDENGLYHIGDMMLTKDQLNQLFGPGIVELQARGNESYRWPNGIIPYDFSPIISKKDRKFIRNAIQDMNNKLAGCIKIR